VNRRPESSHPSRTISSVLVLAYDRNANLLISRKHDGPWGFPEETMRKNDSPTDTVIRALMWAGYKASPDQAAYITYKESGERLMQIYCVLMNAWHTTSGATRETKIHRGATLTEIKGFNKLHLEALGEAIEILDKEG